MEEGEAEATGDRLAVVLDSLLALRSLVEALRSSAEECRRDVNGLRSRVNADTQAAVEVTRSETEAPPRDIDQRNGNQLIWSQTMKLYDLPTFAGNTEDWPLFWANYRETTENFQYSDRQNLLRLRKCLAGAAKEAVASMLIYPTDVAKAMNELEFRFGRPDLLVKHQIQKVQQFPNIGENRVDQVIQFSSRVRNVVAYLSSADCQQHLSNPTLLEQLVLKMPTSKQFEWTRHALTIKPFVTVIHFSDWLSELARVVCLMPRSARNQPASAQTQQPRRLMHASSASTQQETPRQDSEKEVRCFECGGAHRITNCSALRDLEVPGRWQKVRALKLCFSCLRKGHNTASCRSKRMCNINGCRHYHNRYLHAEAAVAVTPEEPARTMLSCQTSQPTSGQLFKILPVTLFRPNGQANVFAMFDEGSAISILEEGTARDLGLKGQSRPLTLQWYGQTRRTEPSLKVDLEIRGRYETVRYNLKNIHTIRNLDLPVQSFEKSRYGHLDSIPIKDYAAAKPVLLLDLDYSYLGAPSSTVEADDISQVAIKTKLGWVAYGPAKLTASSPPMILNIREERSYADLHQTVSEFFAADNFGVNDDVKPLEAEDDIKARKILEESTQRIGQRFECGLLWKNFPPALPDSYEMARGHLNGIEKKIKHNAEFASRYKIEMQKYLEERYARKLSDAEVADKSQPMWYLPHFKLVRRSHGGRIDSATYWSDSQTVLHWMNSTERRFKAFVGHRIAEILATTTASQWRWNPTDMNTTDIATRPKWPPKFRARSPWLMGPEFLRQPEECWPTGPRNIPVPELLEEEVKLCIVMQPEVSSLTFEINRFSSYFKLKRTMAWVLRAVAKFRRPMVADASLSNETNSLTASEISRAEKYICKGVQQECYAKEIADLRKGKSIAKSSSIYTLTPYLDDDGLLRIQGRIDEAQVLPYDARRPILLPRNHAVSELVMRHYHEKLHHQNQTVVINEVRQRFWLPHARVLLKHVEHSCLKCKIDRARPTPPLMGQLPPDRVTPFIRPFTYTGVDLFGPLHVAIGKRREKRWAVLFTCLTVRAAHIEIAESLSTDAFILCLRNFVNRRGTPVCIRSDNGTNFVGAQRELKTEERLLDVDRISDEATSHGIEWKFNCPLNPSSGGCWERLIRIVKRLLVKTLREETPRLETLRSVLIEAENIINSRPLTEIPISSRDDEPLTPNHFLLGCANSTQTPQTTPENICLRKQWRIAQNMKDRLWKRWVNEYLPQLLLRPKWHDRATPLKLNDLVLVCDASQPRSQWRKGHIVKVFPAADGQIRFAEVKTATGIIRRPATKLAVLNLECESPSDSPGGRV